MNELRPKLFDVMKGYSKAQLIKDIIAGITQRLLSSVLERPMHVMEKDDFIELVR